MQGLTVCNFNKICLKQTGNKLKLHHTFLCVVMKWYREVFRVQRKSVLQPAIWASCSQHVLVYKSFQLVPKPFLISRIDYNPSVICISPPPPNSTCPSGKLRTKITSPIENPLAPGYRTRLSLHTGYFSLQRKRFDVIFK